MQIVMVPGRLKEGVAEADMLEASDRFQTEFVADHPGVRQRIVVADEDGGYADIVLFADEAAIASVMEAEQRSEAAREFLAMWEDATPRMYRVLQRHG